MNDVWSCRNRLCNLGTALRWSQRPGNTHTSWHTQAHMVVKVSFHTCGLFSVISVSLSFWALQRRFVRSCTDLMLSNRTIVQERDLKRNPEIRWSQSVLLKCWYRSGKWGVVLMQTNKGFSQNCQKMWSWCKEQTSARMQAALQGGAAIQKWTKVSCRVEILHKAAPRRALELLEQSPLEWRDQHLLSIRREQEVHRPDGAAWRWSSDVLECLSYSSAETSVRADGQTTAGRGTRVDSDPEHKAKRGLRRLQQRREEVLDHHSPLTSGWLRHCEQIWC